MADLTRRTVLISLSAAALGAACRGGDDTGDATDEGGSPAPERAEEPAPWAPEGEEDTSAFPFGVQIGDATVDSAILSLLTSEKMVTLVVMVAGDAGWEEVERREGLLPTAGYVRIALDALSADTAWSVVFYAADGTRRSAPARFRTALPADGWRVVTFGATSCLGGNEPWLSLSAAAEERYDFFCLLGDTVYADDAYDEASYRAYWERAMAVAGMRDLCESTSLIATWDDHEVGNNWSWEDEGIADRFSAALAVFSQHIPRSEGQGTAGIWRKLSWGSVLEVFVLECRAERVPEAGIYISQTQLDWLKSGLSQSTARFKIILNSVPITDFTDLIGDFADEDRWSGFPEQRTEILAHIEDSGITGVLWIAGDLHWAAVAAVGRAGELGEGQREVMVGPGGSTLNVAADLADDFAQFPLLFAQWNHTRFSCDPGTGIVSVRFVGDEDILAELDIQL